MDTPSARASTTRRFGCGPGLALPCARRPQRGFTLVEVIISAGLLGFLALTATFFWVDSFRLVQTVNDDSAAIADGRAVLERLAREIREVKYNPNSGAYCVSTPFSSTLLAFKKTAGAFNPACGTNDFDVTIQSTNLNLTYAGSLAASAVPNARLTSYSSNLVISYFKVDYTAATTPSELRFVELRLTVLPPGAQATTTRTVVALRNN